MLMDLNTPICFLIKSVGDVDKALRNLPGDKASIRTYVLGGETRSKTPFHPNISKAEARELVLEFLKNERFEIMLSEGVSVEDSQISAISRVGDLDIYTEYVEGPGTVRRLSMGQVTPKTFTWNLRKASAPDERFQKAMVQLNRLHCQNILFEWSWSQKVVGWKKEHIIFWEFMNDGPGAEFEGFIAR